VRALLEENDWAIRFLVKTEGSATVGSSDLPRPAASSMRVVASQQGAVDVLVSLKGLVTPEKEKARAEREKKRIEKDIAAVEKKLGSPNFTERAPKEVVEEAHEQLRSLKDAMARLIASATLTDEL
jgi:valyl-tRNA synthetase